MKKVLSMAALALVAAASQAAPVQETFSGITSYNPLAGTPSITGTVITFGNFGAPFPAIESAGAFDGAYATWGGTAEEQVIHTIPEVTGAVYNAAFAIRVNALDTTPAENKVDVISFRATGGAILFELRAAGTTQVLRMTSGGGFAGTEVVSATAFDPLAPAANRWDDGTWRIIACRITPSTSGAGSAKIWVTPAGSNSGLATPVVNLSGLTTDAPATGVGRFDIGGSITAGNGASSTSISMDSITIWPSADIADDNAFTAAVSTVFGLADVSDWTAY
jgi:hypothetical protein